MRDFRFDPDTHTYYYNEKEVPGVSHILKTTGLITDYTGMDPFYRDRGTAVHKAIELFLEDKLDEDSLDPVCVPYFSGFRSWFEKEGHKRRVQASEQPLLAEDASFAGTLDLVMGDVLFDYKCTKSPKRDWELQGAAYQQLWADQEGMIVPFKVVMLPGDGTYRLISYDTPPGLWDHVMGIYNWKTRGKK